MQESPLIPAKAGTQFFREAREVELAFFTYIVASRRNGTLYTGSTDNLINRVIQHREKRRDGFTLKYGVAILVWYEVHGSRDAAFRRERQIKEWKRVWKLELIEKTNPGWTDLFEQFGREA